MARRTHLLAALLLVALCAERAVALEYCVTCEGPPAMYRCVIDGTPDGPGKDPTATLHCITQMARRGGHETCSVARGAPFPCPGLAATVEQPVAPPAMGARPPPDGIDQQPATHADQPTPAAPDAPGERPDATAVAPPAPAEPARVPRTVEELAGETVKSSKRGLEKAGEAIGGTAKKAGEQIGNAGNAIGNAASKTWTCITSLFGNCAGEADAQPEHDEPPHTPADTRQPAP